MGKLADTTPADCGELLDDFVLSSGANAMLVGPDGRLVDTGAKLTVQAVYEDDTMIVTTSEQESAVGYHSQDIREGDTVAVTMSEQATITAEVVFAGRSESYTLYVTPRIEVENLAVRALVQMAPWLLLVLLIFSLPCAFIYSRYITRPIVRMSGIAYCSHRPGERQPGPPGRGGTGTRAGPPADGLLQRCLSRIENSGDHPERTALRYAGGCGHLPGPG